MGVFAWMVTVSVLCVTRGADTDYNFGTFQKDFVWGAGSSASQVEGAWMEEGKVQGTIPQK